MNYKELADLLFPDVNKTIEYYENKYPKRNLKEGAVVTRFAPSPTGFVHIGGLLTSFIERKVAKQTGGIFYLRIEDTDQKREIDDGIKKIIFDLNDYEIEFDEGPINETEEKGNYGPYIQSKRKEIYHTFAKHLVALGKAYPCFLTEKNLEEIRKEQEEKKERIGICGKYAKCRRFTIDEIKSKIDNNEKYVIRLKSLGNFNNKRIFNDLVKGEVEMPENDLDIVLIKSDGLPMYHFAHVVDDYLMRTTHVIRGDEWLSSLPIHIELFETFGFTPPKYAHISPLLKNDNGSIRKISKRKDPEAAVSYYTEKGIPTESVKLYLSTIANSNFEMWYEENPDKSIDDFEFAFSKVSSSGSLFDMEKLLNISRNYISKLKAIDVYNKTLEWAKKYDKELENILTNYKDYSINVLNIEREVERPRKDIACYSDVKKEISYMFDELFKYENIIMKDFYEADLIKDYINSYYDESDDKPTWFSKVKDFAGKNGFAAEVKEYKLNPSNYKGHVGDVCELIRVIATGRVMSPDLYEILKLLGKNRILKRIDMFKDITN